MKKQMKCASLIAAALFAVAPVTSLGVGLTNPTVVQADANEPDPDATKLTFSLKKKYVVLKPGYTWDDNLANVIKPNHGKISYVEPIDFKTYKKGKNGKIDWNNSVGESELSRGTEGVVEVPIFSIDGLNEGEKYTFLTRSDESGDLVWETDEFNGVGNFRNGAQPVVKIPFVVGSKKSASASSAKKVNIHGYVKVRKNHKVRTYTSTGKFSKHYVYGHHTYKLNRKKHIKGHGTCYKIYGKNQWIPSKYLKLK